MKLQEKIHGGAYVAETKGLTIHTWARFYDAIVGLISLGRERQMRTATLDLIDIKPGSVILDVGCGTGSLAIEAKKRQGPDGIVVGIDPSSNMVSLASRKADKAQVDVDFKIGLIEKIDFPEGYFDIVLSSLMMHHLPDDLKKEGIKEVQRVLKPSGIFLILDLDTSVFSLASILHGRTSHKEGPPGLAKNRQYMQDAGYVSIEAGKSKTRALSYLKGMKAP